jgi:hypothetical protein
MKALYFILIKIILLFSFIVSFVFSSNGQIIDTAGWSPSEKLWATIDFIKFKKDIASATGLSSAEMNLYYDYLAERFVNEKINFFYNADQGLVDNSNLIDYIENWNSRFIEEYQNFLIIKDNYIPRSVINLTQAINGPCENIGFESGSFTGWTGFVGEHCIVNSIAQVCTPINGFAQHCIMTPGMVDPLIPGLAVVAPGSNYSLRLGNTINGGQAAGIRQVFKVDSTNLLYIYRYAVVLEDPQDHTDPERPYFTAILYDENLTEIDCSKYTVIVQSNLSGFNRLCVNSSSRNSGGRGTPTTYIGTNTGCPVGAVGYDGSSNNISSGNNLPVNGACGNNQLDIYWKNWTTVSIPLNAYFGKNVTIEFIAADCEPSGHLGYAYLDGDCLPQKILSIGSPVCVRTNQKATLSGPQGFSAYQWIGPAGGIVGPSNTENVSVALPGIYNVTLIPFNNNLTGNTSCNVTLSYTVIENCSLPVDFINFTAERNSFNSVKLQWSTASESNNSTFEVQRSVDGIDWIPSGSVKGNGTKTVSSSYSFLDVNLMENKYYYRLKQTDNDGNSIFSDMVLVTILDNLDVVPSVVMSGGEIKILNPLKLEVTVSLFDINGQLIQNLQSKEGLIKLSGNNLYSGIYIVKLLTPDRIITKKVLVY